jgi:hypothetical protein
MILNGERFIPEGTILTCPSCKRYNAILVCDIWPDKTFDWRAIRVLIPDSIIGVCYNCDFRYVTFDGVFYTDNGAE